MKKWIPIVFITAFSWSAKSQNSNLELLSNKNDFPQSEYNDIWGYVDKAGREYAILGVGTGTAVYLLENPAAPRLLAFAEGTKSIWRDMKSFGDYVYVVADQGADGILAIDMSQAPEKITWKFHKPIIGTTSLNKCHNLYIDAKGSMFLSGCNVSNGGVLIFEVASSPGVPNFIGPVNTRYSHDNFSRGDTLWSADVYQGQFSVVDVSNKKAPRLLATHPTSSNFAHNCWLSDDGRFLFTTDEKAFATVDAYDVSDLGDIRLLDRFIPRGAGDNKAIPHNTHYHKGFLATSWYTEGVVLTDAHRPQNLVEVGRYDTYTLREQGFHGCWGTYPFLPSGLLLASDIESGLYVLRPEYRRACYLEGVVRDATNRLPIASAQIQTPEGDILEFSGLDGIFRGGRVRAGPVTVIVSAPGYLPDTVEAVLQSGAVADLEVLLAKMQTFQIAGKLFEEKTKQPVSRGTVLLTNPQISYTIPVNASGVFSLNGVREGNYELFAGAWGYKTRYIPAVTISGDESMEILIEEGYYDDFVFDQGWKVQNTVLASALIGAWQRGIPQGTIFNGKTANPAADVENDLGKTCFVTGLSAGAEAGANDLDGGQTILVSPAMDLSSLADPVLSYRTWFFNDGGTAGQLPNDSLVVRLFHADTSLVLEWIVDSRSEWRTPATFRLRDYISLDKPLFVSFSVGDLPPNGHIVEAGVDAFRIEDAGRPTSLSDRIPDSGFQLTLFPNPCSDNCRASVYLPSGAAADTHLEIRNVLGQLLASYPLNTPRETLELNALIPPGMYWIRLQSGGQTRLTKPWIKQ